MQHNDRSSIKGLHSVGSGVALSMRDASGTTGFKQKPTPIEAPTNGSSGISFRPSTRNAYASPYDSARMKDTLSVGGSTARGGNKYTSSNRPHAAPGNAPHWEPRQSTILMQARGDPAFESTRPLKRQKLDLAPTGRSGTANAAASSSRAGNPNPFSTSNGTDAAGAIPVDDDDEDVGVPIGRNAGNLSSVSAMSEDPLDVISAGPSRNRDSSLAEPERHHYEVLDNVLALDGPSTSKLKTKQRNLVPDLAAAPNELANDPIELLSDEDDVPYDPVRREKIAKQQSAHARRLSTPGGSSIPLNNVRPKVARLEETSSGGNSPLIDFKTLRRPIQQSMKPKNAAPVTRLAEQKDLRNSIATAPSNFQSKGKQRAGKNLNRCYLPVKAWTRGLVHCESPERDEDRQWWLGWDGESLLISQGPPRVDAHKWSIKVDRYLSEFSYSKDTKCPLIQVKTLTADKKSKFPEYVGFSPGGARGMGTLTFIPMTEHPNALYYLDIVDGLKGNFKKIDTEVLDKHGAEACWKAACQRADVLQARHERVPVSKARLDSSGESIRASPAPAKKPSKKSTRPTTPPHDPSPSPSEAATKLPRPKPRLRRFVKPTDEDEEGTSEPLRRSARQSAASTVSRPSTPVDLDELILIYPQTGTGAVNLTKGDLHRLKPGEFLNDTLIEFGLKLWMAQLRERNPELAEEIHIFSSFFYKKLNVTSLEDGYKSVRKWTARIDLFKKKYVIVPINEHLHWFLAIIYRPDHVLEPPPPKPVVLSVARTRKQKQRESEILQPDVEAADASASAEPSVAPSEAAASDGGDEQGQADREDRSIRVDSEGDGTEVEHMLSSCSLEDPNADADAPMRDASPVLYRHPEQLLGGDGDVIVAEEDVDIIDDTDEQGSHLLYPSNSPPPVMDVDVDEAVDSLTERSASTLTKGRSTRSPSGDAPESAARVDQDKIDAATAITADIQLDEGNVAAADTGLQPSMSTVRAANFYGTRGMKRRRNAADYFDCDDDPPAPLPAPPLLDQDADADIPEVEIDVVRPTTYIFTLDSLGSQQRKAVTVLKKYLQLEAEDKKQVKREMQSEAIGKHALVPFQPNFCDCGVYLLHFTRTFMQDPERYFKLITQPRPKKKSYTSDERARDWDGESVGLMRGELADTINTLSTEWKADKAAKDAATATAAAAAAEVAEGAARAPVVEESDDEIIVEDIVPAPKPVIKPRVPPSPRGKRGKGKGAAGSRAKVAAKDKEKVEPRKEEEEEDPEIEELETRGKAHRFR